MLREELRQAALKRRDHVDARVETQAGSGLLAFETFFVEAACNDQKSAEEYAELHADLAEFDRKLKVEMRADWQGLRAAQFPGRVV